MLTALHEQLALNHIETEVLWNTPKPVRFKSQWFFGKSWEQNGKAFYYATFGDFKTGLKASWQSWDSGTGGPASNMSKEELDNVKKYQDELLQKQKLEIEQYQNEIAPQLEKEFYEFAESGDVPYLRRKNLAGHLFGARIKPNGNHSPIVCVPLRDVDGKFWNYQRIYSEKLSAGDKFFTEGARIDGCFHVLDGQLVGESRNEPGAQGASSEHRLHDRGADKLNSTVESIDGANGKHQTSSEDPSGKQIEIPESAYSMVGTGKELGADQSAQQHGRGSYRGLFTLRNVAGLKIYIAEGFATAASIKLALGNDPLLIVVAAFNANNLLPVATSIREALPQAEIIICGDNDAYTIIRGVHVNVGLEKGRRAAGASRASFVYPIFKHASPNLTDFNDLHAAEGLDKVKDLILNFSKYVKGIQPMVLRSTKGGKIIEPTEKEVADYILAEMKGRLVKQDKALFIYKGTHWEELEQAGLDRLQQMINVAANGLLGSRELRAYLEYLRIHTPAVPHGKSLWQPNPFCANFQDGTLHLIKDHTGKFSMEFKPHNPEDYLTSVLPFQYPDPAKEMPAAPLFDALINRLWAKNDEPEVCQKFARQAIGAAIMPAFPLIAFFWGKPNSGKSTFIKLMVKLVGFENTSSVQPCDWHGFNMESMVSKLINFDTDIDTNKPMNDSEVKKVIDRVPRRVRRKNRTDAYAYFPSVHLFASNKLPKSLDGSSHAYGRRLICIRTESFGSDDVRTRDFEESLLDQEKPGIVARGLQGLRELVETQGQFTIPQQSRTDVELVERESDPVGQFLIDCKEGEIKDNNSAIVVHDDAKIPRVNLWEVFQNWQRSSINQRDTIGKHTFFYSLEERGFRVVSVKGTRLFKGLGIVVKNEGVC
jgi:phage/plasmid primase-like uncharacterized protein